MANNINSAQKMPSAGERIPLPLQLTSAQIKFNRQNNTPVGIADDLKAAASDCLKKCASMLGVAGDVYWRDLDQFPAG